MSPTPVACRSIWYTRIAAHACTGGLTSPNCPLVRRQLAVRVHEPFAQQQHELILRELRVDHRQRNRVKREIPRRVPRILPRVGHRDHVVVVEMRPRVIASAPTLGGGGGVRRIAA